MPSDEIRLQGDVPVATTASQEDYLEALHVLADGCGAVRSVDVAHRLGVSRASVSKALHGLRESGFVLQERYGTVRLTDEGRRRASEVRSCHTMIRRFLIEILGLPEAIADRDACRMEHGLDEETRKRWTAYVAGVLAGADPRVPPVVRSPDADGDPDAVGETP